MAYNSKFTGKEIEALLDMVSSGGSIDIDTELSGTSGNAVQNKAVKAALDGKVDTASVTETFGDINDIVNDTSLPDKVVGVRSLKTYLFHTIEDSRFFEIIQGSSKDALESQFDALTPNLGELFQTLIRGDLQQSTIEGVLQGALGNDMASSMKLVATDPKMVMWLASAMGKYLKAVIDDIEDRVSTLSDVASTGSYNDLTDKPQISKVKAGDGISIGADGTISCNFTPTKYYTGSEQPSNDQGNNGDLYLQIE